MRRQLLPALRMTIALTVLLGILYPLFMTGAAQALFKSKANGSYVSANGKVVGSALIGQNFSDAKGNPLPQYFQPRPSAAGNGYDPTSSGASNLGPSNPALLQAVQQRVDAYRQFNDLPASQAVPVDAVTGSGSGLDPDISIANADDQANRVAQARGIPLAAVMTLIKDHTTGRALGILGEPTVDVLQLNIALDQSVFHGP